MALNSISAKTRLVATILPLTFTVMLAAAQSAPSAQSGINANDTWCTFDLTVHSQATITLSQPLNGNNTVQLNPADKHYHVETGFDANNNVILNVVSTDSAPDPTTTMTDGIGRIYLVGGNLTLYDMSGNQLAIPSPTNSPAINPTALLGKMPGASVVEYMVISDPNQMASSMGGTVQIVQGSSPQVDQVTVPLHASGSGTMVLNYQNAGAQWTMQQVTVTPSVPNLQATWNAKVAKMLWNENTAGDTARASQVTKPTAPPTTANMQVSIPALAAPTTNALQVQQTTQSGSQNFVFQHGILSNGGIWGRMEPWLQADFEFGTTITPSLPNEGTDRLTNEATELIGILGSPPNDFLAIGVSQGGVVVRSAAQQRPDLIRGAITVESPNNGAFLDLFGRVAVGSALAGTIIDLSILAGCESPLDNPACFLATLLAGSSFFAVNYAVDSAVPSTQDLEPSPIESPFLQNLNAATETFPRVGIEAHANKRWLIERLGGDFNCFPEDSTCGGRAVAGFTQDAYDGFIACGILATIFGDCDLAAFCFDIAAGMDAVDGLWDFVSSGGVDSSDGIVNGSGQHYNNATASYVISKSDSHFASTTSDKVRDVLIQALDRQFFVPRVGCVYTLSPGNAAPGAGGGNVNVSITTSASCSWYALSNVQWITITSAADGVGSSTLSFSVAPNNSVTARTGTLTISGISFVVTQDGFPVISSLSVTSGAVGTSVTITGTGFGQAQGSSAVTFNGAAASPSSWSDTSITTTVPAAATSGNVVVTVNGTASNGVAFTVLPVISGISPSSAVVGTSVTISGTGFGQAQGSSTVTFNGAAASRSSWNATSITAAVPAAATSGNVVVTVNGIPSNAVAFTVPPVISGVSPSGATIGSPVVVNGTGFGSAQGSSTITFNGIAVSPSSWGTTAIAVPVPSSLAAGPVSVSVTVNGVSSNTGAFTVIPGITNLSPVSGPTGTSVTITGTDFGSLQSGSTVTFNGTASVPTGWSQTSIAVPVPNSLTLGAANVVVTVNGAASSPGSFTVTPGITNVSPLSATIGTLITVTGTNFGSTQGNSSITFNGTAVAPNSWGSSTITVTVPSSLLAGTENIIVTVNGLASNASPFTIQPGISTVAPSSAPVGAPVTITGTDFGTSQGTSTLTFAGAAATPTTWNNTSILVPVPAGLPAGGAPIVLTVNGASSSGASFTVTPGIASITPNSASVGASVTISGTSFGATQGSSTVTFNGAAATTISTWSDGSIKAIVPVNATTGNVAVTVNGVASSGVSFIVPPVITAVSPGAGPVGSPVTITGSGYGTSQGTSTVTFNGVAAAVTSWSAGTVAVAVPATLPAGATNVVITVNGIPSNNGSFVVTPVIGSLSPSSGAAGTAVTINGSNFGGTQSSSTVSFGGTAATVTSWSGSSIGVTVPSSLTTGGTTVVVTVNGAASNQLVYTVTPFVGTLSQAFAPVGTQVSITGTSFGTTQGTSTVTFNGVAATVNNWSNALLSVTVPAGATTGNVVVTSSNVASNGALFIVTSPTTYFLNPAASSTPGLMQLTTAAGAAGSVQSADLINQPAGDYLVQAFDTQAGVPGSSNTWPAGVSASFGIWMQQVAGTTGTLFPEVRLYLNGLTGTPICSLIGTTALSTTNTQYSLNCAPASNITRAATDHYYLWVGVSSTAASSTSLKAQTGVGIQVRGRPAASITVPIQ